MFYIVKRAVKVEDDLRNNAQLLADLASEFAAKRSCVLLECAHDSLCLVRREYADIDLRYRKVRADLHAAYRHERASEGRHALAADDLRHVLLYFLGNLQLPRTFNILFHSQYRLINALFCYLDDEIVLFAFLGKDVSAVDERLLADLGIDVGHLLLVDAHTVCLDHLAALSL